MLSLFFSQMFENQFMTRRRVTPCCKLLVGSNFVVDPVYYFLTDCPKFSFYLVD